MTERKITKAQEWEGNIHLIELPTATQNREAWSLVSTKMAHNVVIYTRLFSETVVN